ncbi:MAG: PDZ domain-containing protein [Candidatus Omnitrophica bacterium]|nr:PDZ domain-containing protein [Candidatus Omnitrophota bacterium]
MKREIFIGLCGVGFLGMLVIAIFTHQETQDVAVDTFHEIQAVDAFKQAAAPCPIVGGQQVMMQPAAMAQAAFATAPAITDAPDKPVLIKYFGCEVIAINGGKVKVTGIMGNSWAEKAGLKIGDMLLSFNGKSIESLAQFQDMLVKAPPEKDYKLDYMRGTHKKNTVIFIGEGEMDGFLPIPQPK